MTAIEPSTIDSPIDEALALAERGIPVFPCRKDKRPITANGFHDATTDPDIINEWWRRNPDALVGVPTGEASGLLVLDVDPGGEQWAAEYPEIVTAANRVHHTPRGRHYLFMRAEGIRNSAGKIAPGVDIRGDGGYVIWWPAHGHESHGEIEEIGRVPEALKAPLSAAQEPREAAPNVADTIPEGQRDNALTSLAGTLRRKGLIADEIAASLRAVNDARCQPPIPESDIQRIANSVARYEPGDPLTNTTAAYFEGETGGALDLSTAGVGDLLNTTPPRREWVIKDRLPHGVVGILGAAGGTGKGFATLQLAVSVATGEPWLGMGVGKEGPTLILSAEDDRDEIHRRLHRVIEHYEWADPFADSWQTANIRDEVARRVYVLDRVGEDNRLTTQVERCTTRTALADRIVEAVQGMDEPPVLIVLDPLSRFDGGDPNDNADGTRLIEAAEHIRKSTGATVLIPHHVNKASSKESAAGQEAIRGASGLVDGARWVGLMTTLRADEAKRYGVDEEEARWYARLDIVKGNYGPPWEGVWLRKLDGERAGVLAPTEMKATKQRDQEIKADEQYGKVLKETKRLIRKHGPMTRRHIRNNYAGTAGVFGVGEKNAMAAIERAVEAGELFESPDESSTGHLLNLAPGDE